MTALRGRTPAQLFAVWMGLWLILNGIAALLSNPDFTAGTGSSELFGGATIANNGWHGLFHLVTGAIGLATAANAARALAFAWAIGAIYLLVAAWGYVDGGAAFWIVAVDLPGSAVHAFEGAVAIAVALVTESSRRRQLA